MQLAFVALFGAELADVFGAPVVGLLFIGPFFNGLFFALVDSADVADHVAGDFAIGVAAQQPCTHIHARKAVALHRETGHFFVGQPGADRQRVEAAGLFTQLAETPFVPRLDVHQLAPGFDGGVHLGRGDLQRVGRVVGRQHTAMAVQDLAPVGHHRQHGGAVAFGLREQVVMPHDLQVDHARGQQSKGDQHRQPGRQHPGAELG